MDDDACNAGETFSCYNGLAAADRIARTATGRGQGVGPRHGRRRHTARLYDPVWRTPSGKSAAGARQRGRWPHRGCRASGLSMGSPNPKLEEPSMRALQISVYGGDPLKVLEL